MVDSAMGFNVFTAAGIESELGNHPADGLDLEDKDVIIVLPNVGTPGCNLSFRGEIDVIDAPLSRMQWERMVLRRTRHGLRS